MDNLTDINKTGLWGEVIPFIGVIKVLRGK